jgi:hypothetical protein
MASWLEVRTRAVDPLAGWVISDEGNIFRAKPRSSAESGDARN